MIGDGRLPGCSQPPFPKAFGYEGARWGSCKFGLSTAARPLQEIRYLGPPYGHDIELTDPGRKEPGGGKGNELGAIIWR